MARSLKTEEELMELVTEALEADPITAGWAPAAIHRHEPDDNGCNWNVRDIRRVGPDADVAVVAGQAAVGIIETIRARNNLR